MNNFVVLLLSVLIYTCLFLYRPLDIDERWQQYDDDPDSYDGRDNSRESSSAPEQYRQEMTEERRSKLREIEVSTCTVCLVGKHMVWTKCNISLCITMFFRSHS